MWRLLSHLFLLATASASLVISEVADKGAADACDGEEWIVMDGRRLYATLRPPVASVEDNPNPHVDVAPDALLRTHPLLIVGDFADDERGAGGCE